MSASGAVMMRLVKLAPAAENPPVVMPAPKTSSWAAVVVTDPLFGVALVPEAERPTSSGFAGIEAAVFRGADVDERCRRIEYDCHGVCPRGCGLDVLGVVDRLAKAVAACRRDGNLIGVPCGILDRGDVGRRVVPPDREDIGIPRHLRLCVGHGRPGTDWPEAWPRLTCTNAMLHWRSIC